MKVARKIKKKYVIAFKKNPLLTEDVQQLATKYSGKRDEKLYVLSARRALGDELYYRSLCQYMSNNLIPFLLC